MVSLLKLLSIFFWAVKVNSQNEIKVLISINRKIIIHESKITSLKELLFEKMEGMKIHNNKIKKIVTKLKLIQNEYQAIDIFSIFEVLVKSIDKILESKNEHNLITDYLGKIKLNEIDDNLKRIKKFLEKKIYIKSKLKNRIKLNEIILLQIENDFLKLKQYKYVFTEDEKNFNLEIDALLKLKTKKKYNFVVRLLEIMKKKKEFLEDFEKFIKIQNEDSKKDKIIMENGTKINEKMIEVSKIAMKKLEILKINRNLNYQKQLKLIPKNTQ